MDNQTISFIIPALNEAKNLPETIDSIKSAVKNSKYEILVIDNGSTDATISIAKSLGARILTDPIATIAKLRNIGVKESSGQVICLIDSDISISDDWETELALFIKDRKKDDLFVTGSRCKVGLEQATFIETNWFFLLQSSKSQYINSGHLITTRKAFGKIGGFDETLKTGEDYDFCQRAKSLGIPIIENKKLKAFHRGYPKTIKQFFLREAWHGRSDTESITSFLKSKIAIISFVNFLALLTVAAIGIISLEKTPAIVGLILLFSINLLITIYKFGVMPANQLLKTGFCFEIYMMGRVFSVLYKRKRPAARE